MGVARFGFVAMVAAFFLTVAAAQQPTSTTADPVLNVASMERSVDPCVDFYTYSCAGWMKNNPIPPDQPSWVAWDKMQDENTGRLRGILEEAAADGAGRNAAMQKIGDYYASCMDEKAVQAAGIKPLQPYLDAIDSLHTKQDLAQVAANWAYASRSYWSNDQRTTLFFFSSDQDAKDSSQTIAEAFQGGLGLPDRDYYFNDDTPSQELRQQYVAHVQKMFELLGDKPETAASEAQAVMRIETALAKGSMTQVELRDPQKVYHKMSVAELQTLAPNFPWNAYFAKIGLPSLASLNVATPHFFQVLSEEIGKEDLASWKAYMRWHLAHVAAPHLSSAYVNADFEFYGKTLEGTQQLEPRWKRCTNKVDSQLGDALAQAYVEKYFNPEARQQALKMAKRIEAAMEQEIDSLPWMSALTKQRALEKLHAVTHKIGYPDKWRDYSRLNVIRGDAMGNALRADQFEFSRQIAEIGKPTDRSEWAFTAPTPTEEYNPSLNDITFTAGALRPPVFDLNSDAAPNFGDAGSGFGHELTHAFDDQGRHYDAQGNLRDWWMPDDEKEFVKRASCISDQYSTYTIVDDIKINGELTLGEDMADLGGAILAYMAWKEDTKGQRLNSIDGLTPEQRFFVGYSQYYCANVRDEVKRMQATVNPHSPVEYRVNGVVSNMPEFQEAFHCKAGSPMVNQNRCKVW
jgi:endothelin-converting enzyme/putative endopeptidase